MPIVEPDSKHDGKLKLEPTTKNLREFGVYGSVFFLCFWALKFWVFRHGSSELFLGLAAFLLITGLLLHAVLKPVFIGWVWVAGKIGWLNTRLILGIVFYGVLTPIALIRRWAGKNSMTFPFDPSVDSYWVNVQKDRLPENYEKQF